MFRNRLLFSVTVCVFSLTDADAPAIALGAPSRDSQQKEERDGGGAGGGVNVTAWVGHGEIARSLIGCFVESGSAERGRGSRRITRAAHAPPVHCSMASRRMETKPVITCLKTLLIVYSFVFWVSDAVLQRGKDLLAMCACGLVCSASIKNLTVMSRDCAAG